MARIVVDPVKRIEGHLRIEAEVQNGKIVASSGERGWSRVPAGARAMKPPYNYGISQEDAATEEQALDLRDGDRLLCIASAGEIPLNLSGRLDIAVDAADFAPAQIALCRLKLAACRALEPMEAAAFLGFMDADAAARRRLFDRTAILLSGEERLFWASNPGAVEGGPVWAGRFERYLARFSPAGLAILGAKRLRRLFDQDSVV